VASSALPPHRDERLTVHLWGGLSRAPAPSALPQIEADRPPSGRGRARRWHPNAVGSAVWGTDRGEAVRKQRPL